MEINNIVIEAINKEHGEEILAFFSKLGVNTFDFVGCNTLENNYKSRFYGVIDGEFKNYSIEEVNSAKAAIIPTGHFMPREMMVWSNEANKKIKQKVIGKYNGKFIVVSRLHGTTDSNILILSDNAEEIPQKIKITRAEFEAKYQIVDSL